MDWLIANFPPKQDLETRKVLKKSLQANKYLAELKGLAQSIPNQSILINTLSLQEAKDSSEIENIITTYEDLFKADKNVKSLPPATKEVYRYADALLVGFEAVNSRGFISLNHIMKIHSVLTDSEAGFRKQAGTELRNEQTGETVYIPPQSPDKIMALLSNLETYINDNDNNTLDDLVRTALIHHQFESIHPFSDGNGRTGRILNILYLILKGLMDIPILYLSRYITSTTTDYYRLLQHVRDTGEWEDWILYILEGVEVTAKHTIEIINTLKEMMQNTKNVMRENLPKIYSQDLLNIIYRHPYTKTINLINELQISRPTATRYLELLAEHRILNREKIGRDVFYINEPLANLFFNMPSLGKT
ncbi:MAG: Fic family protein [Robiginitomaculum sp.]|nr:Fic family protein [Robiginitomaculum sp.]